MCAVLCLFIADVLVLHMYFEITCHSVRGSKYVCIENKSYQTLVLKVSWERVILTVGLGILGTQGKPITFANLYSRLPLFKGTNAVYTVTKFLTVIGLLK